MSRLIVVVSAGLGVPSSTRNLADQLADAVQAQVSARGEGVEIRHIAVRDLAIDLAQAMAGGGLSSPALTEAKELVAAADGLIAVSPVFSASYSGLFKMFWDAVDPGSIEGTPVLLAATAGTPRHSLMIEHAMRPLFAYLRAVTVPTGVFAATDDFGAGEGGRDLQDRVRRAASQLATLLLADESAVAGFAERDEDRLAKRASRAGTSISTGETGFQSLLRRHGGHGA